MNMLEVDFRNVYNIAKGLSQYTDFSGKLREM